MRQGFGILIMHMYISFQLSIKLTAIVNKVKVTVNKLIGCSCYLWYHDICNQMVISQLGNFL